MECILYVLIGIAIILYFSGMYWINKINKKNCKIKDYEKERDLVTYIIEAGGILLTLIALIFSIIFSIRNIDEMKETNKYAEQELKNEKIEKIKQGKTKKIIFNQKLEKSLNDIESNIYKISSLGEPVKKSELDIIHKNIINEIESVYNYEIDYYSKKYIDTLTGLKNLQGTIEAFENSISDKSEITYKDYKDFNTRFGYPTELSNSLKEIRLNREIVEIDEDIENLGIKYLLKDIKFKDGKLMVTITVYNDKENFTVRTSDFILISKFKNYTELNKKEIKVSKDKVQDIELKYDTNSDNTDLNIEYKDSMIPARDNRPITFIIK
ncbi:hypothetical protein BHU61_09130 [Macrococcus epidermidis]|uniref:Uncharacterized protein n=1 Tax=Macrococcus epidermidis TaxID=1902580 RepID=A0A327ZQ75_9STAP|nr:hypothetical protein [Macrococcus epidermidis]RAK44316.1 hypothetical protein BHU61_09130 [Macrococcus epidermidis]